MFGLSSVAMDCGGGGGGGDGEGEGWTLILGRFILKHITRIRGDRERQ